MRIIYITAGAAGMYCGSCMHDNTLVSSLIAQGHDALLVPTYTPIRTDEDDVSSPHMFFGGINVYLQQRSAFFRSTPWFIDRLLNARWLLRWVSRFAAKTEAADLGPMTISMLKGEHGFQKKEIDKLIYWLARELKPDVIHLTNVLLSGMVHSIKDKLDVPVLGSLQGDDIFLEALPEEYRKEAIALISEHCREMDGFIATSSYYADFMSGYLDIPREKIQVVYPGLNLKGHNGPRPQRDGEPFTIGYFARICHEKGLHHLIDAFRLMHEQDNPPPCRLHVSGWLGDNHRPYLDALKKKLKQAKLLDRFEHVDSPDHQTKVNFLKRVDVLSVPTVYREPKGLYVLEAWANGVPVVQPRHGSFPELIESTGGGLLVNPEDPEDLARTLRSLMDNAAGRQEMAERGRKAVLERFHAGAMATETVNIYRKYL